MKPIKVMVNGLPAGNMANKLVERILRDDRFELVKYSLTGPEIAESSVEIGGQLILLISPDRRKGVMTSIKQQQGEFISLDFTRPEAANGNAEFYCEWDMPFVMGTTGGDRPKLNQTVEASQVVAVIALNMAKQVVGFQAMMEYAAATFPNLFAGHSLLVWESHQAGKADTSGTAKAVVKCLNKLGIEFSEDAIIKERDPEVQRTKLGIAEQYLGGHGWHTYTVISPDGTVELGFTHNINGRDPYVAGALDAVVFLDRKVSQGAKARVFTMIDVLKG